MKKQLVNLIIFTVCFTLIAHGLCALLPSAVEYANAEKPSPPPIFFNKQFKIADEVVYYYRTIKIDGCEYLAFPGGITHKGNCSNPIHRGFLNDWEIDPQPKLLTRIKK